MHAIPMHPSDIQYFCWYTNEQKNVSALGRIEDQIDRDGNFLRSELDQAMNNDTCLESSSFFLKKKNSHEKLAWIMHGPRHAATVQWVQRAVVQVMSWWAPELLLLAALPLPIRRPGGIASHRRICQRETRARRDHIRGPNATQVRRCAVSSFGGAGARRVPPRAPVGVDSWRRWLAARKRVLGGGPGTRGTRPSRVCPQLLAHRASKPPALRVLGPSGIQRQRRQPGESAGICWRRWLGRKLGKRKSQDFWPVAAGWVGPTPDKTDQAWCLVWHSAHF